MNLLGELEQNLAPHVVDQIFGAGTFEKMPAVLTQVGQVRFADDKAAGLPGSTSQETMTALLEQEAEDLEPALNAKIETLAKSKAFSGNAILAFLEAAAMKELVPLETAAIKALVPAVVAELYKVVPAPVIGTGETIISDLTQGQGGTNPPLDLTPGQTQIPGSQFVDGSNENHDTTLAQ